MNEKYILFILGGESLMLTVYPYVIIPDLLCDIKSSIKALLHSNKKDKTFVHVNAVADMNVIIAEQYGLNRDICELSGYLHDISTVIAQKDMLEYATIHDWYIDEAERKYPFLLHQRISKVIAQQDFDISNEQVLSAIECHSTLKANPSAYDMSLFVADKLSWDQEGRPPYYAVVNDALQQSLKAASLAYMDYIVKNKMILYPHKWFIEGANFLRKVPI